MTYVPQKYILNTPVCCLHFQEQVFLIYQWAKLNKSKVVCLANVHMVMEAYWNQNFVEVLANADLVAPDGMPLVWMLRKLGASHQNRVAGMDVFLSLCNLAAQSNISIFFVGSRAEILKKIKAKLKQDFPSLKIAGMESLPFRTLTKEEDNLLIDQINQSHAGITFVCLGCPKQEIWMDCHKDRIKSVMIGVGAVFEVYAGIYKRAPRWIRNGGWEWLYRLIQEPKRLWNRYRETIPSFIYLAVKQLLTPYQYQLQEIRQNLTRIDLTSELRDLEFIPSNKIGEILIKNNLITTELLAEALSEQKTLSGSKIGDILVKKKLISSSKLQYYLNCQNIKIGELMLEKGFLSTKKLNYFLNYQKINGGKIGEIMIQQKALRQEDLNCLLIEQYWRKNFGVSFL